MDNNKRTRLQKLMRWFRVGINKDKNVSLPNKMRPLDKNFKLEHFPPNVEKLWKFWIGSCHDDAESFRNMVNVWEDMDMCYFNDPIIQRAMDLTVDEVIQADLNTQPIGIEGSEKIKDYILKFFDKINLFSHLMPITYDVVQYGNNGTILVLGEKGVDEIIPIEIYDFKSVLEFTPYEVQKKIEAKDKFFISYMAKDRIDSLVNTILNKDNYASFFKSYLLGYQVGDYALPPWRFLHFKNRTNKSPFKPFGIPPYIHCVSPYRQYDAAMTIQQILRGANIPIDVFNIKAPNVVDPVSKLQHVIDFIRNYQNSGFSTTRKEESGVGETIFTIEDLFSFDQKSSNISLDKIDDIEMLRDNIIVGTGLPRYIVDLNDSGFGDSGVALIQKWKPFARFVYRIQSIMLESITQLVKIHMIQSQDIPAEEMKFLLTMPYPESQMDSELITNQKDLLDLSNDILDVISSRLFNDEPVPEELVQTVFQQILPYDQSRIDQWFDIVNNAEKQRPDNPFEEGGIQTAFLSEIKKLRYKNNHRKLFESAKKIITEQKIVKVREGCSRGKHFYSSINTNADFKVEQLREWDKQRLSESTEYNVEVKVEPYVFKSEEGKKKPGRKGKKKINE